MPMSAEFNSIILAFAAGYCYRERSIQVSADMYFLLYFIYFLCGNICFWTLNQVKIDAFKVVDQEHSTLKK